MTHWDDDGEFRDYERADPPHLEVGVTSPEVLAYLYGPDGTPIATLLDRRVVPFGFHGRTTCCP